MTGQIAKHELQERVLQTISAKLSDQHEHLGFPSDYEADKLSTIPPHIHYYMSNTTQHSFNLFKWLNDHSGDSALEVCTILCSSGTK